MSLNIVKKFHQLKTLSHNQVYHLINVTSFNAQETPLCTSGLMNHRVKASLTLEAAIVLPIFLLFSASILFLFRAMQIEQEVEEALEYAVRTTSVTAHTSEDLAQTQLLFYGQLEQLDVPLEYVAYGAQGFVLSESEASDAYVELSVSYRISNPISFFGLFEYEIHQRAKAHKWIGKTDGETDEEEELVYITDTGSAYHSTTECPYLDLSIYTVSQLSIEWIRNASGQKYKDCEKCRKEKDWTGVLYVTDYGDVCHSSLSCSGLKRTVHMVCVKDLEGYHACSKCKP